MSSLNSLKKSFNSGKHVVIVLDENHKDISADFKNWILDSRRISALDSKRFKEDYLTFLVEFKKIYKEPSKQYKTFSKLMLEGDYLSNASDFESVIQGLGELSSASPEFTFRLEKEETGYSTSASYVYWFNAGRCQFDTSKYVKPTFDAKWQDSVRLVLEKQADLEIVTSVLSVSDNKNSVDDLPISNVIKLDAFKDV